MKRRIIKTTNTKKISELIRRESAQEEDVEVLKILFDKLKKRYNLSSKEVMNFFDEEILVPCSIFTKKLSPLETSVKYLKENTGMNYSEIATLIGRNRRTIWQAYKNASKKQPEQFIVKDSEYNIPASLLKDDLSILEAAVAYLRTHHNLNYREIGELLQRNERTIWTVYSRAKKKQLNIKIN